MNLNIWFGSDLNSNPVLFVFMNWSQCFRLDQTVRKLKCHRYIKWSKGQLTDASIDLFLNSYSTCALVEALPFKLLGKAQKSWIQPKFCLLGNFLMKNNLYAADQMIHWLPPDICTTTPFSLNMRWINI